MKVKPAGNSINIQAENSDRSWQDCIYSVENIETGSFSFPVEDFERAKNYFAWLARSKHEYSTPDDLLKYLGRPVRPPSEWLRRWESYFR